MIKMMHDNPLTIRPARDPDDEQRHSHADGTAGAIFDPQAIHGDASFSRLLDHHRQAQADQRQQDGLDDDTAELLPLMLSLARLSARAHVLGAVQ